MSQETDILVTNDEFVPKVILGGDKMQIDINIEKIITRSIIDGILNNPDNLQEEIDRILESDDCQKILTGHIKNRINDLLFSEDGKKQIDKIIIDGIANSDKIQNDIEEIIEDDEYQEILAQHAKTCLHEAVSSEEGKKQIFCKVKEYLENYDIDDDSDLKDELNKGISDILIMTMRNSLEMRQSNRIDR